MSRRTMRVICAVMRSLLSGTPEDSASFHLRDLSSRARTSSYASRRNGQWRESRRDMSAEALNLTREQEIEVWIARVRFLAVLFAVLEVGLLTTSYPDGYETVAWIATA